MRQHSRRDRCERSDRQRRDCRSRRAALADPIADGVEFVEGPGVRITNAHEAVEAVVAVGGVFDGPQHLSSDVRSPFSLIEAVAVREDFSGRGRILIVEDEPSVRAFAIRALTARGYTVVEADSGEAGLEAVENDKDGFELILSDVVMPEMDGPTMLKELRRRNVTAKFIFMSGYAEDAFERNSDGPTDFEFLQKPFSLKDLVEKVKTVLG